MKEKVIFKTTIDFRVKIITFVVIAISLFLTLIIIIFNSISSISAIILFSLWTLIIFSFLLSPYGYCLCNGNISILTRVKKFNIPVQNLITVRKIGKEELSSGFRVLGIGGLFGYVGIFYLKGFGFCFCFATNYNDLILIKSKMTFLISPSNSDLFLRMIKEGEKHEIFCSL